jgi:hypothetical protein
MDSRFRDKFTEVPRAGGGFNPYSAGKKHYGTGRPMPTVGKVMDRTGYQIRDTKAQARRDALLRRMGQ